MEFLIQAGAKLVHFSLSLRYIALSLTTLASTSTTLLLMLLDSYIGVELSNLVGVLAWSRDLDRACPIEVKVA